MKAITKKGEEIFWCLLQRVVFNPQIEKQEFLFPLKNFCERGPVEFKIGLRVFLFLFECLPFLFSFIFCRFTKMSNEKKDKYIDSFLQSNIYLKRSVFRVLMAICLTVYYSQEKIKNSLM